MLGRLQRGDTLIEVLFAVSVFSFVVITALTIMNQGTAASQRSLEITLVRQQIDAQAETLRFMHDAYVAAYQPGVQMDTTGARTPAKEWYKMIKDKVGITGSKIQSASPLNSGGRCSDTHQDGSFILDPRNVIYQSSPTSLAPAVTFAQVSYDTAGVFSQGQGIWIEPVRSPVSTDPLKKDVGFIDFHIMACWDSSGMQVPSTQGTIVRLYEPRG